MLAILVNAQQVSGYVNVRDYIVKAGNPTDHTEAIRQAIADSSRARNFGLLFPPGDYRISDTIDISAVVEVVGQAYPRITQTNPDKDIFYTFTTWRMTVRGLSFHGGRDQVALGNQNTDQGFLVVSDCRFFEANGAAVRFLREEGNAKQTASSFCLVEKCAFSNCAQTLISVSDQAHLRDCWISTKPKRDNKAVIENFGVLTCQNILGVPRPTHNDQRWIDNYGTLSCKTFRFGGEGAGFTPVVNYAKYYPQEFGPSILLEDCFVSALGNNKRACAIYLEEIPNQIIVRDCMLGGVPAVKVNPKLDLKTYFTGVRPGMLRFDIGGSFGEFAGELPEAMIKAAANRKIGSINYGDKQLNPAQTKKALASAVAAAKRFPSVKEPGVMTYGLPQGQQGHRQITDPDKYLEITPKTHHWDLSEMLDGLTELCSAYLAIAPAGDEVVVMSRMDGGSWPHIRIRNITVDLDKTPFLTWRLKDNGVKGGHWAVKVTNTDTEAMTLLVENYNPDQYGYFAYDLRKALDIPHGTITIDLKCFLCGSRDVDALTHATIKKGEYFLVDFIRLEADNNDQ
jgi:hypothetical protein